MNDVFKVFLQNAKEDSNGDFVATLPVDNPSSVPASILHFYKHHDIYRNKFEISSSRHVRTTKIKDCVGIPPLIDF
jgi:hypothetical protein